MKPDILERIHAADPAAGHLDTFDESQIGAVLTRLTNSPEASLDGRQPPAPRTRRWLTPIAAAAAALALVGGTQIASHLRSSPTPTAVSQPGAEPTGTPPMTAMPVGQWIPVSISENGRDMGSGSKLRLEISKDSVKGFDGINPFYADHPKMKGDHLHLPPLSIGASGCGGTTCEEDQDRGRVFVQVLSKDPAVSLNRATLTLTAEDSTVRLIRADRK